MAVFFNCSYARAAVKAHTAELMPKSHVFSADARDQRRAKFAELFQFSENEVSANPNLASFQAVTESPQVFDRHCRRLLDVYNRSWAPSGPTKKEWLSHFCPASWKNLPKLQQLSHDLHDCYACAHQSATLHSAFPVKSTRSPSNTMAFSTKKLAKQIRQTSEKTKCEASKKAAKATLDMVRKEYKTIYGGDIRKEWAKQSSSGLQLTPTSAELRQARREIDRVNKADREKETQESDFKYFYSTTCSSSSYEKQRRDALLDTREKAEKRMRERLSGKQQKSHVSLNFDKITWNWRALVKEAETWQDGQTVKWQAVARRYGVHRPTNTAVIAGNGGQIVQAVLTQCGIDVTRFLSGTGQKTGEPRVRRSVKRTRSGIVIPSHTTMLTLKEKKEQLYEDRVVCKSIPIVPREYMHTKFKDTDQVHIQKKTVHGQKAPLHELIRTIMQNFREKGILAAENYNPENMTHHEVDERLQRLGISIPEDQEQKTSSGNRVTTSL